MISCCNNQHFQTRKSINNKNIIATKPRYTLFVMIGIIAITLLYITFSFVRYTFQKKHKVALASLQWQVDNRIEFSSPYELEARMRKLLPKLEELSRSMSSDDITKGTLATWQMQLGLANKLPSPSNPWNRIWLAKRLIALGQNQAAESMLAPLRKLATIEESWGFSFWSTLISLDQLQGNREQGWQDVGEYKSRFKDRVDPTIERIMDGI
jgi:hypothetical protein